MAGRREGEAFPQSKRQSRESPITVRLLFWTRVTFFRA
jgi:hypothetical protein